jgi:hypothetical protein
LSVYQSRQKCADFQTIGQLFGLRNSPEPHKTLAKVKKRTESSMVFESAFGGDARMPVDPITAHYKAFERQR